jgi:hypothetical protein
MVLGGNATNFPRNPRFRPNVAFVSMATSVEMDDRENLLTRHPLMVSEEGGLGLRSAKELKNLTFHHFGFRRHELYVYRSNPTPFIIIFSEKHAHDVVFVVGRIIEGLTEL